MSRLAWRLALAAVLACLHTARIQATPDIAAESSPEATSAPAPTAASSAPTAAKSPDSAAPTHSLQPPAEKKPLAPSTPGTDEFGRLLGYITLLAAAAGAAIYLIKFGIPLHRNRSKEERKLQVLEMRPLGNRQFLIVVGYEDTRMLLGVTPGKIDYLCPLDSISPTAKDFAQLVEESEKKGANP